MKPDSNQAVFPFLAEDPLYRREVREERIVQDVTDALQARLSQEAEMILREVLTERLEAFVRSAVSEAIRSSLAHFEDRLDDLCDFARLVADLRFPSDDSADWWKQDRGDDE